MRVSGETAPNDIKEINEIPQREQTWLDRYFWLARFVSSASKTSVSCARIVRQTMVEFRDCGSWFMMNIFEIGRIIWYRI
jgi:hypothetical protein